MQSAIKKSEKEFLTKTVLAHADGLKRFALSLAKNEFDSDDLVAETVLKAFENFHQLKDRSKIKQWLFRILNNQFISNYRNKRKTQQLNTFSENEHDTDSSFSLYEEISESTFVADGNPETKFISRLTQASIQNAIDSLPDEFKTALVLCDVEEFSYAEIANVIQVPVGTVRSRIARARNILQKKLWLHAQELGIKKSKTPVTKDDYVCTCGKEELKPLESVI